MIHKANARVLVTVCGTAFRICVGGMLLWHGLGGISRPYENLRNVYALEVFSPNEGIAFAMISPWLEVVFGACLVSNVFRAGAWMGSLPLFGLVVLL